MRIRLKSGFWVGGFYGTGSFASSYPESQDLYLEQAWSLDESGSFSEPIEGSAGLLISRDQMEMLELIEIAPSEEGRGGR